MKIRHIVLLTLACIPPVSNAAVVAADRVIAVVNNEAVTEFDLKQRLTVTAQQMRAQNIQLPAPDVMTKQVLERLITDRIQLQYARDTGLTVSESDLDATLRRIAESNSVSVAEMQTSVERDGMSWGRFRQDIREQVILSRVRDREVDNRVNISAGEIESYLANPPPVEAGKVNVAHILIRAPEQVSPEQLLQLRSRAEQARLQARSGEEFGKVAATFSDAPDALSGGIIGLRPVDGLPPLFAEAIGKLQPGGVSDILRSPAGFHVLKLLERQESKQGLPALKQTHARHILIKVNEITSEADAQRKLATIKERLDHGVDFAEVARLYSEDLSAAKGGDLGWLYQGDTVPEFERAMDDLAVNELSKPIRSPFGFHLIQVLERRVDEGSKERQSMVARMTLRERKADEVYQDWLRQLRDEAYVEYRLEDK